MPASLWAIMRTIESVRGTIDGVPEPPGCVGTLAASSTYTTEARLPLQATSWVCNELVRMLEKSMRIDREKDSKVALLGAPAVGKAYIPTQQQHQVPITLVTLECIYGRPRTIALLAVRFCEVRAQKIGISIYDEPTMFLAQYLFLTRCRSCDVHTHDPVAR